MRLIMMLTGIVLALPLAQAHAQDPQTTSAWEELTEIRDSRPLRSSKYLRSKAVLSGRVLDETNRVVGEVRDIVVDRNGAISQLNIDFNRLRLGTGPLLVGYDAMGLRPATNGFKMNYTDDEIRARVPQILSNIESASGREASTYSVKALIGQSFYSADGKKLGQIKDVVFDKQRNRAKLLYVSLSHKPARGKKLTIPLREMRYKADKLTLRNNFTETMLAFAQEK